jgi:molybdate transport system substrate-binding protein
MASPDYKRQRASVLIASLLGLLLPLRAAAEIRVAVASNFAPTLRDIAARFGQRVSLITGSTGKHYAQISNGAPFDAFFAADVQRAQRLEEAGLAVAGSRFTYAIGKLVLWSPRADYVDPAGAVLKHGDYRHLALANPTLAPYGRAAREVLQAQGLWQTLQPRLVRGESVGQAFQFVGSGNAPLGFVAWSQIQRPGETPSGSWWKIPETLYTPIAQQALLLNDSAPARAFLAFVRGPQARQIIQAYGYANADE